MRPPLLNLDVPPSAADWRAIKAMRDPTSEWNPHLSVVYAELATAHSRHARLVTDVLSSQKFLYLCRRSLNQQSITKKPRPAYRSCAKPLSYPAQSEEREIIFFGVPTGLLKSKQTTVSGKVPIDQWQDKLLK